MLGLYICLVSLKTWVPSRNKPKFARLNKFFFFIDKTFFAKPCSLAKCSTESVAIKEVWPRLTWKRLISSLFYNGAWKNMAMNDTTTAKRNTQIQIWFNTRAAFLHSSRLASRIICCRTLSARILLALFLSPGTWPPFLLLFDWLIPFVSLATRISLSFTGK